MIFSLLTGKVDKYIPAAWDKEDLEKDMETDNL